MASSLTLYISVSLLVSNSFLRLRSKHSLSKWLEHSAVLRSCGNPPVLLIYVSHNSFWSLFLVGKYFHDILGIGSSVLFWGTCHKSEDPQVRRPTSPMSTSPTTHKCDVHKSDGPQVRRHTSPTATSPTATSPTTTSSMTTSPMTTSPMTTSPMSVCATVLDTFERMVETTFVGLKLTQKCCFSRHCSRNCKWKWYNLDVFWVIFVSFLLSLIFEKCYTSKRRLVKDFRFCHTCPFGPPIFKSTVDSIAV